MSSELTSAVSCLRTLVDGEYDQHGVLEYRMPMCVRRGPCSPMYKIVQSGGVTPSGSGHVWPPRVSVERAS